MSSSSSQDINNKRGPLAGNPTSSLKQSSVEGNDTKIDARLKSLTEKEKREISTEIERLIKNEMSYIVRKYIRQFRVAAFDVFGWTEEDLLQQVRIALWKGIATYVPDRDCKLTTYLSTVLFNYFMAFSTKLKALRNSQSKLYPVEELFHSMLVSEEWVAHEILGFNEQVNAIMEKLTEKEKIIFRYYALENAKISMIAKETGMHKTRVQRTVKKIKLKILEYYREIEDQDEEPLFYEQLEDTTEYAIEDT